MAQGLYDIPEKAALGMQAIQALHRILYTQILESMTQGEIYTGALNVAPILNSTRRYIGSYDDSGFIPDGSIFVNEVASADLIAENGDYYIDYMTGYYVVQAGDTGQPTVHYYIASQYVMLANTTPFSETFESQTTVTVTHNLGYNPQIWVTDSEGNLLFCNINYAADMSSFTLIFGEAQSGTIYYR